MKLRSVIVGCGRSGTGFLSNFLRQSGVQCGHEDVFDAYGFTGNNSLEHESSWYVVPYLELLPKDVKLLHITRSPYDVIKSFCRLGLFRNSSVPHITRGYSPKNILALAASPKRFIVHSCHTFANRQFLKRHTSAFLQESEESRAEAYWREWNFKITDHAANFDLEYLHVCIEDFASKKEEVADFLRVPVPSNVESLDRNLKRSYINEVPREINLEKSTRDLMKRYGYFHSAS